MSDRQFFFEFQSRLIGRIAHDVADLCYEYNINYSDSTIKADIIRICQYCTIRRVISTITRQGYIANDSNYTVIVVDSASKIVADSIRKNTQLMPAPIVNTLNFMRNNLKQRFIEHDFSFTQHSMCINNVSIDQLTGELQDKILISLNQPPRNLSNIKRFVSKNGLNELEQQFDKSVTINKTLTFL